MARGITLLGGAAGTCLRAKFGVPVLCETVAALRQNSAQPGR
ncbi:MAG TPA: hypothetical protein VN540_07015 [Clostridia bacterium]|nr:hypothetical protein [Clostridia bacterium]